MVHGEIECTLLFILLKYPNHGIVSNANTKQLCIINE